MMQRLKVPSFLFFVLFTSSTLIMANEEGAQALKAMQEDHIISQHMKTHIATGGLALASAFIVSLVGESLGAYAVDNGLPTWISHKMGSTPENSVCEDDTLISATYLTPYALSCLIGLYMVYKTPQWTDKHILKADQERTTKQNIKTFLGRALIPWPFGVLLAEKHYQNELAAQNKEEPIVEPLAQKEPEISETETIGACNA